MSAVEHPLTEDKLVDAIVKFREQTDANGFKIAMKPEKLVVASDLELAARRILAPQTGPVEEGEMFPPIGTFTSEFALEVDPYREAGTWELR